MSYLLDPNLIYKLRDIINKTDIFIKDEEQSKKFNMICAVMDRFDTAVIYFNEHQIKPKNEIELMTYINQVAIIKDGVNYSRSILKLSKKEDNEIFKKYYERDLNCTNGELNDDSFFNYFRSLSMAHPFLTTTSIPNAKENEKQYSPYCLTNLNFYQEDRDVVGVCVYSNERDLFSITFPFEILKEYVLWKYNLLQDIIDAFDIIIKNKESEWKKRKVNRKLSDKLILEDIIDILDERYIDSADVKRLLTYFTCEISNDNNNNIVGEFRSVIKSIIPSICDCVDNMNYNELYNIIGYIIYPKLKELYPMMHYQLEKIYCYLNDDDGDINWGLKMADSFSKEFSKKWVEIKPYEMNFDEIKMLTTIACYYESKE